MVVVEDPIVRPTALAERVTREKGCLRAVFKPLGDQAETLFLVASDDAEQGIQAVTSFVVGAYYFIGIVTRAGVDDLPENGAEVSDEQMREWVRGTTHFVFRGPSYDGYVLWTASG